MGELNWGEHIAREQNQRIEATLQEQESIRQRDEMHAAKQEVLHGMDRVVKGFLWAAGTQGWPGVQHEYETVTASPTSWRRTTTQRYVGAHYTSRNYIPADGYPLRYPHDLGIRVYANGSWIWQEVAKRYDNIDYLTCTNSNGVLAYDDRLSAIQLHPEETPQKVMSVLAQIAVDNAIVL